MLVRGAGQAVANGGPFWRIGRKLNGKPVEAFAVEVMKATIELRGVGLRLIGHTEGAGGLGLVREPEISTATGFREMALGDKQNASAGAVVFLMLSGGAVGAFGGFGCSDGVFDEGHAGAKNFEAVCGDGNDGGFEADFAGPTVEKKGSLLTEGVADVLRGGGGEVGEAIGAGSGDREIGGAKKGEGNGVAGDAQANGREASGDFVGNDGLFGDDKGKGAGPILVGETVGYIGPVGGKFAGLINGSDVDDKGAGGRTLFERVDLADGGGIESVGAEAVDGFGGEDHESAGTKDFRGFLNEGGIRHGVNPLSQIRRRRVL